MNQNISLFDGITEEEYQRMMVCFHATEKSWKTGETICRFDEHNDRIGYLLEGEAAIIQTHYDGRQTIIEHLKTGGVFGSALTAASMLSGDLQVSCIKNCRIQFINYEHLTKRCSSACAFHSRLVRNALELISKKVIALSERLEVLCQRTTRDKQLCYFHQQSTQKDSISFLLPFSFATLADYLSVDRSAMMREIRKLKDEGLISTDRKKITLLHAV